MSPPVGPKSISVPTTTIPASSPHERVTPTLPPLISPNAPLSALKAGSAPVGLELPQAKVPPRPPFTALTGQWRGMPPELRESLRIALNDPKFVDLILTQPNVLRQAATLDHDAIVTLIQALPDGAPIKSQLTTLIQEWNLARTAAGVFDGLRGLLGGDNHAAHDALEERVRSAVPQFDALSQALCGAADNIDALNANPKVRASVDFVRALELPLGTLLSDMADDSDKPKLDGAILGRLMHGSSSVNDAVVMLRYVRDAIKKPIVLDLSDKKLAQMASTLGVPLPTGAVKKIAFDKSDNLTITLGNDKKALEGLSIPGSFTGETLTFHLDEACDTKVRLHAPMSYGQFAKGAWHVIWSGDMLHPVLDVLLRVVGSVVFFLVWLGALLVSLFKRPNVKMVIDETPDNRRVSLKTNL